ncbi:MAG: AMP-binding protein, partial [Oscillospiraceae bacterium]|nr:AMP-binding protein [Oscillospiraceae bacterium]
MTKPRTYQAGNNPMNAYALRDPLSAINGSIERARTLSEFYRPRLPQRPLGNLQEVTELPFTSEADIRRFGLNMLCASPAEIPRIITLFTSGTTESPKRVYYSEYDLELTVKFFRTGMQCVVSGNDRVHCMFPGKTTASIGDLLAQALRVIPIEVVSSIADATCVVCSPQQALELNAAALPDLRKFLLTSEYVSDACRATLHERFDCEIYEHYGMRETGLGFAVSCAPDVDFYHIRERDLYVEVIDPDTLQTVSDGTIGEVVFTTLIRGA